MSHEEPLFYCGDELHKAKLEKVQRVLKERDLDALMLFKSEAVRYVTDFYVKGYRPFMDLEYLAVVPREREPIIGYSSGSDKFRIKIRCPVNDTRKLPHITEWPKVIRQILMDYGLTNAKIGTDLLPFSMYLDLAREFPRIRFVDASEIWVDLTAVKHPKEIEIIQEAIEIAEIGMRAAIDACKEGVRETDIAAAGEYAMRMAGSEMNPIITAVLSGVNSAIMERLATRKRVRHNEFVRIDLGCVYKGYTGEFGRTTFVGKPTEKQKEMYKVVYNSLMSATAAVKPGVKCSEVDSISRRAIREAGYKDYEHGGATGHQLGYGLHGDPMIAPGVEAILQPNMIVNMEPAISIYDQPETGGCFIEDTVQVTESGHKLITRFEYDEKLLGSS